VVRVYECECCKTRVKDIPCYKRDECPADEYQHHFKKVTA